MQPGILVGSLMVVMALGGAYPSVAQGLGDAARQERERRDKLKAEGKSGRTLVDADSLKANKGQVANTAPGAGTDTEAIVAPASASSASSPTRAETPDAREQDEAAWRQLLRAARANVEKLQRQYDMLSSQHLAPGEYFVDARTGKRVIGSAQRLQGYVAQAKTALEAGQRQLDALEERARREHVPPGWLR